MVDRLLRTFGAFGPIRVLPAALPQAGLLRTFGAFWRERHREVEIAVKFGSSSHLTEVAVYHLRRFFAVNSCSCNKLGRLILYIWDATVRRSKEGLAQ